MFTRCLLLFIFTAFISSQALAETKFLEGSVSHRNDLAPQSYLTIPEIDPNFALNTQALSAGLKQLNGNYLYDYGLAYGVVDPMFTKGFYFHKKTGKCFAYDYYIGDKFPKRSEKYDYGTNKMTHYGIVHSPTHAELYTLKGKMTNTWVGLKCIRPDGTSCGSREIYQNTPEPRQN